jgi:putative ABC transport system ATP-binding protein
MSEQKRERTSESDTKTLLAMRDIGKVFVTDEMETHALAGVHLEIKKGEWVAIVGPSGSGKSSLLSILGLLDAPTSGRYTLGGQVVSGLSATELAKIRNTHIGFIFQTFNLIGDLTIFENVELPLVYRGVAPAERRDRVTRALDRVGIAHRGRHMPGQLSGGQQQRAAIARAVVGEPSILLADEPTGNLDSKNGQSVVDMLEELNASGATICMVTHDVEFAKRAERSITLFDGRIVHEQQREGLIARAS